VRIRTFLFVLPVAAAFVASTPPIVAQSNRGDTERRTSVFASPEAIGRLIEPVVGNRGGRVGVAIYSVERETPLYLHHADDALVPASNMKLYTTAAALDKLGPDFQYTTSIYADGPIHPDGTLDGNLIIVGRGDPSISGRFYADSVTYVFDRMAAALRERGIRRVTGRLIGDASYFDGALSGPGWESGNMLWWYGARVTALAFNDNVVTVIITPGASAGAPAEIEFSPSTDRLAVVNRATTSGRRGARSIGIRRRPDLDGYEIWGRVPVGGTPVRYVVSVENPPAFALSVLRNRLLRVGVDVNGDEQVVWRREHLPRRPWTLVASHTSPRLIDLVRVVNKNSQNFFAEQILKTMGAVFEGRGSFDAGGRVISETVQGFGISTRNIVIEDGSGLSRWNVVTARATAELLVSMRSHPRFEEFYGSLLVAGHDGDPRRLDSPEAVDNVRTKTGTLRGVSALSGYVTTEDGELLAFSVITNGLPGGKGASIAIEDAVAERLARFSSWSSPLLESQVTGR
jgi:D-alanyl-D-alanine carboxypeptidase/D-alanyl-D-alanine-endopeptidase (penicillin-binding protein 4)